MRANAPKPSQQSKANRSNGTKTRHMGFFSLGIRWGEKLRTLPREVRANPVDWEIRTPTNCTTHSNAERPGDTPPIAQRSSCRIGGTLSKPVNDEQHALRNALEALVDRASKTGRGLLRPTPFISHGFGELSNSLAPTREATERARGTSEVIA